MFIQATCRALRGRQQSCSCDHSYFGEENSFSFDSLPNPNAYFILQTCRTSCHKCFGTRFRPILHTYYITGWKSVFNTIIIYRRVKFQIPVLMTPLDDCLHDLQLHLRCFSTCKSRLKYCSATHTQPTLLKISANWTTRCTSFSDSFRRISRLDNSSSLTSRRQYVEFSHVSCHARLTTTKCC